MTNPFSTENLLPYLQRVAKGGPGSGPQGTQGTKYVQAMKPDGGVAMVHVSDTAAMMHGAGSAQHEAAIAKYGTGSIQTNGYTVGETYHDTIPLAKGGPGSGPHPGVNKWTGNDKGLPTTPTRGMSVSVNHMYNGGAAYHHVITGVSRGGKSFTAQMITQRDTNNGLEDRLANANSLEDRARMVEDAHADLHSGFGSQFTQKGNGRYGLKGNHTGRVDFNSTYSAPYLG